MIDHSMIIDHPDVPDMPEGSPLVYALSVFSATEVTLGLIAFEYIALNPRVIGTIITMLSTAMAVRSYRWWAKITRV